MGGVVRARAGGPLVLLRLQLLTRPPLCLSSASFLTLGSVLYNPVLLPSSPQQIDGEGQVRRGRRLLHALLTLDAPDGEAGGGSGGGAAGGQRCGALGFYAPEFAEAVKAPRGLDLHMVAARLDAGLYQATGRQGAGGCGFWGLWGCVWGVVGMGVGGCLWGWEGVVFGRRGGKAREGH